MRECWWLTPVLVGQFEFTEWTPEGHLRHSRFVPLREVKEGRRMSLKRCRDLRWDYCGAVPDSMEPLNWPKSRTLERRDQWAKIGSMLSRASIEE
jgi:hypothetical protein